MTQHIAFNLHRDAFGKLVFTESNGQQHQGVLPVRAFPITAPQQGIALVSQDGHELAWLADLAQAPEATRSLIEQELASREFVPEIQRIVKVSSFATPCTWTVDTDRGAASFILKSEDDIRRLASPSLLISDSHGIQFLIRDRFHLDGHSRRILDRFL